MKAAVFPGTFDPITEGHMDVIAQAARLFDRLIVAILHNPAKTPLFSIDERVQLIRAAAAHLDNVVVDTFSGLLAQYAKRAGVAAVIRGVRDGADVPMELRMAHMNRRLNDQTVSVWIPTRADYACISSSLVKEIARLGGDTKQLVPPAVHVALCNKFAAHMG